MSTGVTLRAPRHTLPVSPIVDRNAFILERSEGKCVLHLGCADWPFTAELVDTGQLLHQQLEQVSTALAGIDISEEGIALLRRRAINNLFTADASRIGEIIGILGWTPEVIIAGEILEHVDAPGPFLRECARHMPSSSTLVITVPNAFSIKGVLYAMLGFEKVNSDHVAYYSYATLIRLVSRCGLEVVDARCYKHPSAHVLDRAIDVILSPLCLVRPYLCGGLIFSCRKLCS